MISLNIINITVTEIMSNVVNQTELNYVKLMVGILQWQKYVFITQKIEACIKTVYLFEVWILSVLCCHNRI